MKRNKSSQIWYRGGHRLVYRLREGEQGPVVFIHGLGASGNSFDPCFESEKFEPYGLASLDLPGCGRTGWIENFSYTVQDQAKLVLQWIQDLGLTGPILAGHSMGGVISLYVAEALGTGVRAFFNLEGNLSYQDCVFSAEIAKHPWKEFEKRGRHSFLKMLDKMIAEDPSPGLKNYKRNILKAAPRALYLSAVSLVHESRHRGLMNRYLGVVSPKWYFFGEKSMNHTSREFLERNHLPYLVVPGSGHFMMDDRPELFYPMLLEVLEKEL